MQKLTNVLRRVVDETTIPIALKKARMRHSPRMHKKLPLALDEARRKIPYASGTPNGHLRFLYKSLLHLRTLIEWNAGAAFAFRLTPREQKMSLRDLAEMVLPYVESVCKMCGYVCERRVQWWD